MTEKDRNALARVVHLWEYSPIVSEREIAANLSVLLAAPPRRQRKLAKSFLWTDAPLLEQAARMKGPHAVAFRRAGEIVGGLLPQRAPTPR
jgi:hypothetical protein